MRTISLIVLLLSAPILADSTPPIATDSRVRITAPSLVAKPLVGTIASIQPDTLILTPRIRIPINAISQLDISLGQKTMGQSARSSAWKSALAVGGVFAAAAAQSCRQSRGDCKGGRIFLAVTGGTVAGGLVGGIYGALRRPERWTTVSPEHLKRFPNMP